MNEKERLLQQLRANAFPHNNGLVMRAVNIIRHGYNRMTDDDIKSALWTAMAKERPDLYRQVSAYLDRKAQEGGT